MKRLLKGILAGGLFIGGSLVYGQVPDSSAPAAAPANNQNPPPSSKPANSSGENKFLGKDVPIFDPSNEIASWDGHNWNLNNNRIFEARFEKYLNAPEETTAQNQQYQAILDKILDLLSPEKVSTASVDEAFR